MTLASSGSRTIAIDFGTLDALNRLQNRQLALAMELGVPLFDLVGTRADGRPVHRFMLSLHTLDIQSLQSPWISMLMPCPRLIV